MVASTMVYCIQGQDVDALTGKQVKSFIDSPYKNIWGPQRKHEL